MPRWLKMARSMFSIGLAFSAAAGLIATAVFGFGWLSSEGASGREAVRLIFASTVWAFLIGVVSSGILALTSRAGSFDRLSLPRFSLLGAGVGLVFFGLLAINAWESWSASSVITNAAIFVVLGGGSAAGTLVIARRGSQALGPPEEPPRLK